MIPPRSDGQPATLSPAPRLPRSFLACLPVLWSRVLFPGRLDAPTAVRRPALALLILLPGLLLYPCLSFFLFEPDEGRYAEIPREMLLRGEWVVPYLQGEPYLDKPPLLYWLVMGSYRLLGVHDWSARLVPALAVHACILLTYLLGRRLVGERAAFWGTLALALAPGFVSVGRLLVLDSLLTLWVLLASLAAFEALRGDRLRWGWWLTAAVSCGLGVLTKGPIAVVLLVPPLLLHRWLTGTGARQGDKETRRQGDKETGPSAGAFAPAATFAPSPLMPPFSLCPNFRSPCLLVSLSPCLPLLAFAAVVLGITLPWYVAVSCRLPAFASYFLWKHNVLRFLIPFDHQEPVWYYGPILLLGLLPASLLALGLLRFLISGDPRQTNRRCPEWGFTLLAGGWCVLFFSLSGCKLPTYVLPAMPLLALALGYYVAHSSWAVSHWTRAAGVLAFGVLATLHYGFIPWFAEFHSPMSRAAEVRRYCEGTPVVCYPRPCDSVAFYLGRADFRSFRSKETPALLNYLQQQPRTVILFTHRHSPEGLRSALPSGWHLTGMTPISKSWLSPSKTGYCYMAVAVGGNQ